MSVMAENFKFSSLREGWLQCEYWAIKEASSNSGGKTPAGKPRRR